MTDKTPPRDDDDRQLEALLASLREDAAPQDREAYDRAMRVAQEAFARRATETETSEPTCEQEALPKVTPPEQRRAFPMLLLKPITVAAASVGLLIATFALQVGDVAGNVAFETVLTNALGASSLQLTLSQDGKHANVLVAQGGRVRLEETPTRYRIATGNRLWRVDEAKNQFREEANPWMGSTKKDVDLLALLGVPSKTATAFRKVTASKRTEHGGKLCDAFELRRVVAGIPWVIRAYAEAETHQLVSIAAWTGEHTAATAPPVAELQLVKRDVPLNETQFKVANTLSVDGRIGKVIDTQGTVLLRVGASSRWTPVSGPILLKPGDLVRTDVRGAHAAKLVFLGKFQCVLGPASMLELQSPTQLRLHAGEVQILGETAESGAVSLAGPTKGSKAMIPHGQTRFFRASRAGGLEQPEKTPFWLAAFLGSSNNESIGSLIANVDGRNEPLTVGTHHVKVEIRDQIARTTIEETFVNHTNRRLEGIFHFPLPQDASISGFGMWIGGQLVEADVVEKQRAREIYETILRERRDPALLEWTGGNIFKARVFPIEANSEKRIKIVYTQVLPLRAGKFRYSYGLRSEMLQQTPLANLSLDVLVHSELPLRSVDCPTHPVRLEQTEHSASLAFTAAEYIPTRDFEVVCEVDSRQRDVVVVPHRRGEDGYFLAQLTPPTAAGNWQRELLPDGDPLRLLIVCDTSSSMDTHLRKQQQEFLATTLATLGPADRFNVATCDVDCRWHAEELLAPSEESVLQARDWLAGRRSLGWTNLDRMAASLVERLAKHRDSTEVTAARTHVIYVGDGIVTSGDADTQAFVGRLERLTDSLQGATFHTVSVGSSFESVVLRALARIGGGSTRQIGGELTPQRTAQELIGELAQPGLTNVQVEFRGLQVAATYPETLPNLSAGTQQLIVGRYLPQGEDQTGEIVITGERDGEPVRYAARITLQDAERSNSFIPRLWARAHLDHLLAQGNSAWIRDEIIHLSEEFHIITPYTSLLVLESDEDRERFGVKRRFLMRDGERFFAAGRDQAEYELLQQQMKAAGDWRLGLRRRLFAELAKLGRDTQLLGQLPQLIDQNAQHQVNQHFLPQSAAAGAYGGYGGFDGRFRNGFGDYGVAGGGGFGGGGGYGGNAVVWDATIPTSGLDLGRAMETATADASGPLSLESRGRLEEAKEAMGPGFRSDLGEGDVLRQLAPLDEISARLSATRQPWGAAAFSSDGLTLAKSNKPMGFQLSGGVFLPHSYRRGSGYGYYYNPQQYTGWLHQLFPAVPAAPVAPAEPETEWPAAGLELSRALVVPWRVAAGGLQIGFERASFDPSWNRQTGASTQTVLTAADRWLSVARNVNGQGTVDWCDADYRGRWSQGFQLGQRRKSNPADLQHFALGGRPYAERPAHATFAKYSCVVAHPAAGRATLTLSSPQTQTPGIQTILTIDTERNVIVRVENRQGDETTSTTEYADFVLRGGCWWAQTQTSRDGQRRITSTVKLTVTELDAPTFGTTYQDQLPGETAQVLTLPGPTSQEAKVAIREGKATFADHLQRLVDACKIQDWDAALAELTALETSAPQAAGLPWIRLSVLRAARQNERARQLVRKLLQPLSDTDSLHAWFLTNHALSEARSIVDSNEMLELLDMADPVAKAAPALAAAPRGLQARRASALSGLRRMKEVRRLRNELAASARWDTSAQMSYAQVLAGAGDLAAAKVFVRERLAGDDPYTESQLQFLRDSYLNLLQQHGDIAEQVRVLAEWIQEDPPRQTTYDRYLAALTLHAQTEQAAALVRQWIERGRQEGRLAQADRVRLKSAVAFALGNRYGLYSRWIDPEWYPLLRETALFFFEHPHHHDVAQQIVDGHRFSESDERDGLMDEAATRLAQRADKLDAQVVASFVRWGLHRSAVKQVDWLAIAGTLLERWQAEEELDVRDALAQSLLKIYGSQDKGSTVRFLRKRIARARDEGQSITRLAARRKELFQHLLAQTWTAESEREAVGLIPLLSAREEASHRLATQVAALHNFVDRMLAARFEAARKSWHANENPEELTRTEYGAHLVKLRRAAREGLAAVLSETIGARERADENRVDSAGAALTDWMQAERWHLDVVLGRRLPEVAEAAWKILGAEPVRVADEGEAKRMDTLAALLQQRLLTVVSNLALRRSSPAEDAQRVLAFIELGIQGGEDVAAWKQRKLALLIGLDESEQIEQALRAWIRSDEYVGSWQLTLARILAEQGKIDDAIKLFETVRRDEGALSSADHQTLAKWYLVADRQQDYQRARVDVFLDMEEWRISNYISQQRQPWYRSDQPLPTELDENVLFAFRALFEKSNRPGQYAHQLHDFYTACRDYRLLQVIPDSLVGRTPQQIYDFLESLQSRVFQELRNEATADEILKRLVEVKQSAETDIDRRACDLLEAMVERRSANVLNQPGPHIEATVAALKRAFQHGWAPGEVRQMAHFLDGMGRIRHERLAQERRRQLEALLLLTEPGSEEHVWVSWHLAHALYYSHNEKTKAIAHMEVATRAYSAKEPGGWPAQLNEPLQGYLDLLKASRRFLAAEKHVKTELARAANAGQTNWLGMRLIEVYQATLDKNGHVTLGEGKTLYDNLRAHLLAAADSTNAQHQVEVFAATANFFHSARKKWPQQAAQDMRAFAFEQFPELLPRESNQYRNAINAVKGMVYKELGAAVALEFLIERMENYPVRFEHTYQSSWREFGYELARYRYEARNSIAHIEDRVLAIVLKELRRDLVSRQSQHRTIFHHSNRHFWSAKASEFARVAEEVYGERRDSGRAVHHIARFFYSDLNRPRRGIEMMLIAHGESRLSPSQQMDLCTWLHGQTRYAESIPILEPLVVSFPDNIRFRTHLITAYGKSDRRAQMLAMLEATDKHFRVPERWTESTIAALAAVCRSVGLYAESIPYYEAVIDVHQRTQPNRGIGRGTLTNYYTELGRSYASLGNTIKAVEAGAGAVVAWGTSHARRRNTLRWLTRIVEQSKDLPGYIAHLDEVAETTGQDSALIRKVVGKALANRKLPKQAIAQLKIALELLPQDAETNQALLDIYKSQGDVQGQIEQTLRQLDFDRHNLELYKQLADLLGGDASEAERAATSIVEAAPREAEHHQALAELREVQDRWDDAIVHWQQVAALRALEPTGLVQLAEAQLHQERFADARATLKKLRARQWPSRFHQVNSQITNLEGQLPKP